MLITWVEHTRSARNRVPVTAVSNSSDTDKKEQTPLSCLLSTVQRVSTLLLVQREDPGERETRLCTLYSKAGVKRKE